jgi:hypothetical protein
VEAIHRAVTIRQPDYWLVRCVSLSARNSSEVELQWIDSQTSHRVRLMGNLLHSEPTVVTKGVVKFGAPLATTDYHSLFYRQ